MSRLLSDEALADQTAVQAVINTTNCTFIEALKSLESARWAVDEAIKIVLTLSIRLVKLVLISF